MRDSRPTDQNLLYLDIYRELYHELYRELFHELCSILLLDDILHLWYFPDGRNDVFAKLSFLASESAIEQIQWLMVQCGLYQFSQELCSLQQIIVFKRYDIFCIGLDSKTV